MDYLKLKEKNDKQLKLSQSVGKYDHSNSSLGTGAKPKTPKVSVGESKKSTTESKPDSEELGEDEKLPGFVIEFRLSKAYQCLQKQEKDVNKLTLKPYRFYRRKRKTPAEILQLAVQKERERKEKEREKAKAKKPKVTFWQVMKSLQVAKKKEKEKKDAKSKNKLEKRDTKSAIPAKKPDPKGAKSAKQTAKSNKPGTDKLKRSNSEKSISKPAGSKDAFLTQGVDSKPGTPSQKLKKADSMPSSRPQTPGRDTKSTTPVEPKMATSKFPKPRRAAKTHVDEEPLFGTNHYAELYEEIDMVAGLPGTVTGSKGKPPLSRHASLRMFSNSNRADSELDMFTYAQSVSSITYRPQSALSSATIELDDGVTSSPSRSRSRTGLLSASSRVRRINSEPYMDSLDASLFAGDLSENHQAASEPRRTSCKYLYNLCNCNTVSKKNTLSKLLKKKKNVSGVIDIYGCPTLEERTDALAVCPFCTVMPRKRINKWLSTVAEPD